MGTDQKWALVTGASAGIGRQFCEVLAEGKWNLILVARRAHLLEELKLELEKKYGIKVEIFKADLLKREDVDKVVELFEKHQVRYLVNNAGIMARGTFDERDLDEADRVIELNVVSLVHLTHGAVRHFKKLESECYILNVGSLNSFISTADQVVYCASKAFVKSFTVALSEELSGTRIKMSCLCPGGTESELMDVAGAMITARGQNFIMKAEDVARIGIEGVRKGQLVVVPGWYNKFSAFMTRFLPERSMTKISSKVLREAVRPRP